MLTTAEHAGSTLSEVQRQVGRLVETQAVSLADTWQRGLEELGAQAEQGLEALTDTTRRQAEEAERAVQAFAESAQQSMNDERAEAEGEGDEEGAEQGNGNGSAEGGNGRARAARRARGGSGRRSERAR